MRWVHVVVPGGGNQPPRAVAHGDDKGEFLLIIPPLSMALAAPGGTFTLPVVVSVPPPLTDDQKKAIRRDPLSDIPVDQIAATVPADNPATASTVPTPDWRAMGWREPAGYNKRPQQNIAFTAGRIHRELFAI